MLNYMTSTIQPFTNNLYKYYKDWTTLVDMVSKTETRKVVVYIKSMKILYQVMLDYTSVTNKCVKTLAKNLYQVEYNINNKSYKMLINPIRGPNPVEKVTDDLGNDITDIALQYMGPKFDWHGYDIKPSFFNVNEIHIEFSSGITQIITK